MSNEQSLTIVDQERQIAAQFGMEDGGEMALVTRPSRLTLTQTNNADPEKGKFAGKFWDEDAKLQHPKLTLIPLRPVSSGRVFFESEELGSKPKCRSNDGIVPVVGEGLFPQARTCATCPKSQFKKLGGRAIKPPCSATASILAMDTLTGLPYRFQGKRSGATEIKKVWENFRKTIQILKAQGKSLNPLNFEVELSALKKNGAKGAYFEPDFGAVKGTSPENTAKAYQLLKALSAVKIDEEEFQPDSADDAIRSAVGGGTSEVHDVEYADA